MSNFFLDTMEHKHTLMIKKFTLRPDKYYSVPELLRILGIAPFDLYRLINHSGILFDLVDDMAVYKGSEIQPLIN